jgi:glycosyltransferase involved in cell wall biosynthesis
MVNIDSLRGPKVEPIAQGTGRPLWSVMIPAFNCAKYLRPCLESVLAQDRGTDRMEIEVIDDYSTKDDPAAVVAELGQGRVRFHRNARNEGLTANFNNCIERSSGELVHILHGDDSILPGFYRKMEELAEAHPIVSFFHARALLLDEAGNEEGISPPIENLASPCNAVGPFLFYTNPFRTAGIVVRRAFYERYGGFISKVAAVSDWEMWVRAVFLGNGLCVDDTLATYRTFAGNATSRQVRTGENLRDCLTLGEHWAACGMPEFSLRSFREMVSSAAAYWAEIFRKDGNTESHSAYLRLYQELMAES